jgi:8-oxo-dGTP pyrophosphatase MutT (NUDIX family)
MVHASKDWAPVVTDDGFWSFPKGIKEDDDGDELSAAIRETFEETGIDLRSKREEIEKITEYEHKNGKKKYIVFSYNDEEQSLMNHKFYCKSTSSKDGTETPEIDSYYWATKKEFKNLVSDNHKGKLFNSKKSS